jgi:hypothetical protein
MAGMAITDKICIACKSTRSSQVSQFKKVFSFFHSSFPSAFPHIAQRNVNVPIGDCTSSSALHLWTMLNNRHLSVIRLRSSYPPREELYYPIAVLFLILSTSEACGMVKKKRIPPLRTRRLFIISCSIMSTSALRHEDSHSLRVSSVLTVDTRLFSNIW